ncbi:hypothetical protein C8R44DRAFT_746307 [Mycena epipterygia]|nr:hypothetical protein C8R44DRAFT_746307 [Mycena epipterygia]
MGTPTYSYGCTHRPPYFQHGYTHAPFNWALGQQTNEQMLPAIMKWGSKLCISAGDCKGGQQKNERTVQMIMRLGSKWCISAGNCKAGQQTNERTVQAIMQPSSKLHIRAGNCKAGQQTNERTVQVIVKPGSKWGGNCETGQSKQGSEWHISAGDCKARQQTNEQMLLAIVKQGSEWCISASNREVGQQMAYQCSKAVNGVSAQVAGQQMNERMLQAIVKQGSAAGNREAGQQMNERMLQAIVKRGSATGDREAGQQIMYQHRQLAANANGVSVQASVKQGQQTNEQAVCLCTRLASSGVQQGKGLPYEQQRWAKIEKTSWPGPNMRRHHTHAWQGGGPLLVVGAPSGQPYGPRGAAKIEKKTSWPGPNMRWGPLAGNRTGPVGLPKLEKRAGSREHGYTHAEVVWTHPLDLTRAYTPLVTTILRSSMSASRCPAAMQYIDDSAQDADHNEHPAFDDDNGDDDEDSAEAELQAGAAMPSRGEDMDMADLPPSHPVSPAFGFGVLPAQQMLHASTPAYMPASESRAVTPTSDAPVFFPDSWGATPDTCVGTPLFMPGSRGPTPYQYDYRNPTPFSGGVLPEHCAGPSSPPPAKQRRLESSPPPHRPLKNVKQYFDTAAEDSNEGDTEEERDEEDEETLSDIATREMHQRELRCSTFIFAVPDNAPARAGPSTEALPVNTLLKSYDHDLRHVGETSKTSNLGTLLHRGPVIEQMPVGGWVRFRMGSNKGRVAFMLSSTKILIARGINNSCQPIELSRAVNSTQADRVTTPSVEEMAPFQTSQHPALCIAPFLGPCAALEEGDQVVVIGGDHRGQTGYIVMLRDVPVVNESGHRCSARYAKIQNEYDGTMPIQKRGPGFFVELGRLKRHLDHPLPPQPLDRVCVVSGLVHHGLSGRAIEINDDQVKVEIPSPSNDTPGLDQGHLPDTNCFYISLRYLSQHFKCGDLAEVLRGLHETRVSMIVVLGIGGSLELFDGKDATHDEIKISRAEHIETKTLQSSREHREQKARRYENTLAEMGPAPDDEAGANNYYVLCNFLLRKVDAYRAEPSVEDILQHDQAHQERISQLMKTKQHFVGFPVQAAFKTHINKGRLGVVKDERESPERRKRLAALTRRRCTPGLSDIKGILCTVQWVGSNQKDDIPIENLVHRFTNLMLDRALFLPAAILTGAQPSKPLPRLRTPSLETPPPGEELWGAMPPLPELTLAGEDTSEWLCNEGLINKRLDIVFKGIATFDNRLMKNSPKWGPLEGRTGVLVLANTAPNSRVNKDSLTKKKVKVFRPGSNTANPLEVPPLTIKPRRMVGDGTSIALITQRVVIVGPSHFGELPENIGRYTETHPNLADAKMYGANYVSVQVEGGDKYMYHTSSRAQRGDNGELTVGILN